MWPDELKHGLAACLIIAVQHMPHSAPGDCGVINLAVFDGVGITNYSGTVTLGATQSQRRAAILAPGVLFDDAKRLGATAARRDQ